MPDYLEMESCTFQCCTLILLDEEIWKVIGNKTPKPT